MKNKIPYLILKAAIFVFGLIALAFFIFALPSAWKGGPAEFPEAGFAVKLIVAGLYATAVPFYIGLFYAWKFLRKVDYNLAFSEEAIKILKKLKYSVLAVAILYMGGVPILLPIAEADDAPGLLIVGFVIACVPFVIASTLHLLQKVLESKKD